MPAFIIVGVIVLIALILAISNIYVVQQSRAYVIERLGAFHEVHGVGIHIKIPFFDLLIYTFCITCFVFLFPKCLLFFNFSFFLSILVEFFIPLLPLVT